MQLHCPACDDMCGYYNEERIDFVDKKNGRWAGVCGPDRIAMVFSVDSACGVLPN